MDHEEEHGPHAQTVAYVQALPLRGNNTNRLISLPTLCPDGARNIVQQH